MKAEKEELALRVIQCSGSVCRVLASMSHCSWFLSNAVFDYVHPYVHVFLKRSAITLVDDHGWPDIYSRLKKLDPTSITAYRVRSLFLLVADEFIGVILSGEGIVSGIPFSMQICIVSNGGVMEASHISIMPTSVKYFLFRGCKNLTRRRSHKQWVVGISIPPPECNFSYIYTKQCGLCGLPGYLSVLTIFCSLVSICCKMHCSLFKHRITRKTSQITRKRPKITRKHIAESRGG
ncbi:hypothetical protein HLX60_16320 [Escherichia coli]|uniref:hypothetical protein n=1 Tax=Escherichia coli TaxID=562 RepID=UPI0015E67A07|nr:hypothetical protein [Escherichia coli]MBA2020796.1 hypothetical protein [Escherichia coli]